MSMKPNPGTDRAQKRSRATRASFLLAILVVAACSGANAPVTVLNDLDFQIALSRCESKRALTDPILIAPGERKLIHPGSACPINGPAAKTGFLGGVLDPGPYLGCLLIPKDSEKTKVTVSVSEVNRDISDSVCEETPLY